MFLSEWCEFPSAPCMCSVYYRGVDKSLARPGMKQANVSVRMAWISFGALSCGGEKKLDHSSRLDVVEIARVTWHASELASFLVGLRTYQHPGIYVTKSLRTCRVLQWQYGQRPCRWWRMRFFGVYSTPPGSTINPLTPNGPYRGRTAPLTSKRCILYIYSTNISTEYFKHGIYSPFFPSKCSLFHNSNVFGSCIIQILNTGCAKIKKK